MNQRERALATITALVVGCVILQWVYAAKIRDPLRVLDTNRASILEQVNVKQRELMDCQDAQFDLENWRKLALPADVKLARTLYNKALFDLLLKAGIEEPKIDPSPVQEVKGKASRSVVGRGRATDNYYVVLPYQVTVRCSLEKLTRFLHGFYSANLLHRIENMGITPSVKDGSLADFSVSMTVQAISMYDALTKDSLPEASDDKVIWRKDQTRPLEQYALVAAKNFFQPTQIVKNGDSVAPTVALKPERDDRKDLKVTAAHVIDGIGELWVRHQKTKELIIVNEGQELNVSGMRAIVKSVSPSQVLLEVNGKVGAVRLGRYLDSWQAIESSVEVQ